MDEQACPRCKTTKYRNPSLKLMVNVCGHTLCEACVDLLFLKGSGSCPKCMIPLRRNNFRVQLFEDPLIEKEIEIRRRVLRDYNKKEDDFETLDEYNNYLEDIETIIYNLVHNIDPIGTNKVIDAYKRENREVIQRNRQRMGRDECELEEILEIERVQEETRQKELDALEVEQKKRRVREKNDLLEELICSTEDAKQIITKYAEKVDKLREEEKQLPPPPPKPASQFSTGIKFGRGGEQMFLPIPKEEEGPLYVHELPTFDPEGPALVTMKDIESKPYLKNVRTESAADRAGGFRARMACQRAIQDSMQGLLFGID